MPRQRRRRDRRTNVFVQQDAPRGREEVEDDEALAAVAGDEDADESIPGTAVATPRARRVRQHRSSRQARARSEIFTRSIGMELRKLGVLTGAIIVALIVLTFVL